MARDRAAQRYRRLYSALLRLYPAAFRRRFAESMEQTFADLCQERRSNDQRLFPLACSSFADTSASILKERVALIMPARRKLARVALATLLLLAVPVVAMRFSDHVNWTLLDFVAAGALLFGAGLAFEVIVHKSHDVAYRSATGLACVAALLLIWINLAVGLIGSEDHPANVLYVGVLLVGTVGVLVARLRPGAMARAMFVTALAQAIAPVLAMVIWKASFTADEGAPGSLRVLAANTLFVLLFAGSALLFRRAAMTQKLN